MLDCATTQRLLDVVRKRLPRHCRVQLPHHPRTQVVAALLQQHAVVGHFLVGVRGGHGAEHRRRMVARHHHFQAGFRFTVKLADGAHKRIGSLLCAERALPLRREAALVVLPDVACTCIGHGGSHRIHMGVRHEDGPLLEVGTHGAQDGQRMGVAAHRGGQRPIDPRFHVVQVGVNRVQRDVVTQREHGRPLHLVAPSQPLQPFEDERMVADNHLATRRNRFFHHRFGAVQTHHDLGDRGIH